MRAENEKRELLGRLGCPPGSGHTTKRESETMKKFLWSVFGVGAMVFGAQAVYSAVDSQQFTVSVPKRVSITALGAAQTKTLTIADLAAAELTTDDDLVFTPQTWAVKGNVKNGVSVEFKAAAFANVVSPFDEGAIVNPLPDPDDVAAVMAYQNTGLAVVVASNTGPAVWSLDGTPNGTADNVSSNYLASTNAIVKYKSDKVGQADFAVTVEFEATDLNAVVAGDYITTVIGTLTEN